jgi:hypothetical protein
MPKHIYMVFLDALRTDSIRVQGKFVYWAELKASRDYIRCRRTKMHQLEAVFKDKSRTGRLSGSARLGLSWGDV